VENLEQLIRDNGIIIPELQKKIDEYRELFHSIHMENYHGDAREIMLVGLKISEVYREIYTLVLQILSTAEISFEATDICGDKVGNVNDIVGLHIGNNDVIIDVEIGSMVGQVSLKDIRVIN
jgi:hypothetical protein